MLKLKRMYILLMMLLLSLGLLAVQWIWPYFSEHPRVQFGAIAMQSSKIQLHKVASGFQSPTDIQFVPNEPQVMVVLEKAGRVVSYHLSHKTKKTVLTIPVLTRSEQGLLGLAFHPDYPTTPCIYLNYVQRQHNHDATFVSEWCGAQSPFSSQKFRKTRDIFSVQQPYGNHNAGQILFGPDGLFYLPLGDGGSGDDPHNNGQNLQTYLGAILRIKITPSGSPNAYTIPQDNPFTADATIPDEIFAYGFRNPWRASFSPNGRLIVADVGQDLWEEITRVEPGGNHGWNIREGNHCFPPDQACQSQSTVAPIFEYGHNAGRSVTGGYVSLAKDAPTLYNRYLFADFVSGRFWALNLTDNSAISLGKWSMLPSTFGRDAQGRMYVADYGRGAIFRITE